jgi:hypothetical protein
MALRLAPDDNETNELLGDCYIRQDKFSLSVPRWQAAGEVAYPKWFAAVRGTPYQVCATSPWAGRRPSRAKMSALTTTA